MKSIGLKSLAIGGLLLSGGCFKEPKPETVAKIEIVAEGCTGSQNYVFLEGRVYDCEEDRSDLITALKRLYKKACFEALVDEEEKPNSSVSETSFNQISDLVDRIRKKQKKAERITETWECVYKPGFPKYSGMIITDEKNSEKESYFAGNE